MGTSIKTITVLWMGSLLSFVAAGSANALATAEDINSLAETARMTVDKFMQESFELRLGYEFSGQFLSQDDRENLQKITKRAGASLQEIAEKQKKLKQQIEEYQGDDWDAKYGSTGLWRRLAADLYTTNMSKCEVDYYLALTLERSPLNKTLQEIREQIISLDTTYRSAHSQLLKAKIIALARLDSAWQILAMDILNSLTARRKLRDAIYFRAAIEKIKLLGQTEHQLETLAEELAQSSCSDDFELVLSLAFLQRRYEPESFGKTVRLWPEVENLLGLLILQELSYEIKTGKSTEQTLQQISVFEAELAAGAAWKDEPKDHKMLLNHLANAEKFQTPLILYVTAVAFAETEPAKTIDLLVTAGKLQQKQKSKRLDIEAAEIARQAAQFSYNLFTQGAYRTLVLRTFDNYSTIANGKMDEESQYFYSAILHRYGQAEKSKKILWKLAQKSSGYWSRRAKLDLIEQAIEQKQNENQSLPKELFIKLNDLIMECSGQNKQSSQLRIEAITVYCQLLLESRDRVCAEKVLNILAEAETARDPNLNIFKSKALQQLGRLDESAECLLCAIDPNRCDPAGEAMELLSRIIIEIDRLRVQINDFPKMMQDCKKIAEFCYNCCQNQQSGLLLAEISIFTAHEQKGKLLEVEKLLNNLAEDAGNGDVDLLRCRARLLTGQGNFGEAGRLWAQVAKIRKSRIGPANQRSWKWWRAKFYELDCWAKCPQTKKEDVFHTIEVLENTFPDIPPLWAEKLTSLKQQCRSRPIGASKPR